MGFYTLSPPALLGVLILTTAIISVATYKLKNVDMTNIPSPEDESWPDFQLLEAIAERDLDLVADAIRAGAPIGQGAREALAALFDLDQPSPFRLAIKKNGKGVSAPWPAWFETMIENYCCRELAIGTKKDSIIAAIKERYGVKETRAKQFIKTAKKLSSTIANKN